jgi:hypothetical protein
LQVRGHLQGLFEHPPAQACYNTALLVAVNHKCMLLILYCLPTAVWLVPSCVMSVKLAFIQATTLWMGGYIFITAFAK